MPELARPWSDKPASVLDRGAWAQAVGGAAVHPPARARARGMAQAMAAVTMHNLFAAAPLPPGPVGCR
jgi:hypothetical protein